jgi:hypothetical protein
LSFAFLIELVLSTAGWTEIDWKGKGEGLIRGGGQPIIRLGAAVENVVIGTLGDQPLRLLEFSMALCEALVAEGIAATAGRHVRHDMNSTNANAIHVLVGRKTEDADCPGQA